LEAILKNDIVAVIVGIFAGLGFLYNYLYVRKKIGFGLNGYRFICEKCADENAIIREGINNYLRECVNKYRKLRLNSIHGDNAVTEIVRAKIENLLKNKLSKILRNNLVEEIQSLVDEVINNLLSNNKVDISIREEFGEILYKRLEPLLDKKLSMEVKSSFATASEISQMLCKELSGDNQKINELRVNAVEKMLMKAISRFEVHIRAGWSKYITEKAIRHTTLSMLRSKILEVVEGEIKDNWDSVMFGVIYPSDIFTDKISSLCENIFINLSAFEREYDASKK